MLKHIYNYHIHSEQRYFVGRDHRDIYDIISLNGNIVSHTPQAVASFITRTAKEYYIDPQTHIFQHPTINLKRDVSDREQGEDPRYEFKPSIIKLAEKRLGNPFSEVVHKDKPLSVNDFFYYDNSINDKLISSLTENVISFQKDFLNTEIDEETKEFIGDDTNLLPKFIIAPYFFLGPSNPEGWLRLNIECYKCAKSMISDLPIFFALVMPQNELALSHTRLLQEIREIRPDGILLWIDDFQEEKLSVDEIKSFMRLLSNLRLETGTIYNSHGGYLSTLLLHDESGNLFEGVGHGMNYGESRPVIPVGGGIPMARFYLPAVHSRLRFGDAIGIINSTDWLSTRERYLVNICSCHQCQKLIDECSTIVKAFNKYGDSFEVEFKRRSGALIRLDYPKKEARHFAVSHYLHSKAKEFSDIQNKPLIELIGELIRTYEALLPFSDYKLISHLLNWHTALRPMIRS